MEELNDSELRIAFDHSRLEIYYAGHDWPVSTASATNMNQDGKWYLNRIIVNKAERGRGFGTALLNKVKEKLCTLEDFSELIVEPGGYDSDPERQRNFYVKNGFETSREGYMYWRK